MSVTSLPLCIMMPSRETAMTGRHDARGVVEFAMAAEAAGFDSVWAGLVGTLRRRGRATPDFADRIADSAPRIYS
jgi:hypothetical protein